jgi:hypothetical protein
MTGTLHEELGTKVPHDRSLCFLLATSQADKTGNETTAAMRSVAAEARVRSRASPCEMWWTKWHWDRLSPATSAFPCLYHSTKASEQCSFVYREALEREVLLPNNNKVWSIENLAVYVIRTRNTICQISIIIHCTSVTKIWSVFCKTREGTFQILASCFSLKLWWI